MRFHHQCVIPAKAGTHTTRRLERTVSLLIVLRMDSRIRGNDAFSPAAAYLRPAEIRKFCMLDSDTDAHMFWSWRKRFHGV